MASNTITPIKHLTQGLRVSESRFPTTPECTSCGTEFEAVSVRVQRQSRQNPKAAKTIAQVCIPCAKQHGYIY